MIKERIPISGEIEQAAVEVPAHRSHRASVTTTRQRFGSRSMGNCMRNMSTRMIECFQMCLP